MMKMTLAAIAAALATATACAATQPTPSTAAAGHYAGAVAALNAYCAQVGTTDLETGPVCSDVLSTVNLTEPVAAAAISYIMSVLTKRAARDMYDAREAAALSCATK